MESKTRSDSWRDGGVAAPGAADERRVIWRGRCVWRRPIAVHINIEGKEPGLGFASSATRAARDATKQQNLLGYLYTYWTDARVYFRRTSGYSITSAPSTACSVRPRTGGALRGEAPFSAPRTSPSVVDRARRPPLRPDFLWALMILLGRRGHMHAFVGLTHRGAPRSLSLCPPFAQLEDPQQASPREGTRPTAGASEAFARRRRSGLGRLRRKQPEAKAAREDGGQ